jgi:hypothetical protein
MDFAKFKTNAIYAGLILMLGFPGIVIARIGKGNWTNHTWSWGPLFWIPILNWPVSLVVLFGGFD